MYYLTLFIIFSIFGFIFENIISVFEGIAANSGILIGPWTPIYGLAILIILLLNKSLKKLNLNKKLEVFLFFIVIIIVLTVLEYIGGHLINKYLHQTFWDYSNLYFNYGKYISLEVSLAWGIIAIVINYYIYPKMEYYLKQIPKLLTIILTLILIMDIIITTKSYLNM